MKNHPRIFAGQRSIAGITYGRGYRFSRADADFAFCRIGKELDFLYPLSQVVEDRDAALSKGGAIGRRLARVVATALSDGEGWNVIVENKPGAVGTIGAAEVLKQPADGHALLSVTAPFAAIPGLLPDAKFKVETDFAPLIQVGTAYNVLAVNPMVPVHSVSELIAYLKKDPGKYTFSSGGFGTPAHLLGEMFKLETGVQTTHGPYVQFPQAIADLLSGVNTYQFITMMPVMQHINRKLARSGRDGPQARRGPQGRSDHRRSGLSSARL
jgi:hypothetical protein